MRIPPPFFGQWESRDRIGDILSGALRADHDPLWPRSGARDAADYARWAEHLCGMACLRMALAGLGLDPPPLLALAGACAARGGYVEEPDGFIRGLIYAPCVALLAEEYGIGAEIVLDSPAEAIPTLLARGSAYIASVHPMIRQPEADPPARGGHLVLVFAAAEGVLRFHNPSGDTLGTQEDVRMTIADFARFHAERGILLGGRLLSVPRCA